MDNLIKLQESNLIKFQEKFKYYFEQCNLRKGQAYINTLHDVDKELYVKLAGTEYDCYYDDNKISKFLEYIISSNLFNKKQFVQ